MDEREKNSGFAAPYPRPELEHKDREGYPFAGKPLSTLSDEKLLGKPRQEAAWEPVFVLSALDVISPALVRLWADLQVHNAHCTPETRAHARRVAAQMENWQRQRGMLAP